MKLKIFTMALMAVMALTIFGCGSSDNVAYFPGPINPPTPAPGMVMDTSTTTTQGVDAANVTTSTGKSSTTYSYDDQSRTVQSASMSHVKFGNISSTTTRTTQNLAFDSHNNVTKDTATDILSNGAKTETTNITQYSYMNDGRLLSAITATVSKAGDVSTSSSKTRTYSYPQTDGGYIVTEVSGPPDVTIVSTYDSHGNVIIKTSSMFGLKTTTSYIYNLSGYVLSLTSLTNYDSGKITMTTGNTLSGTGQIMRSASITETYNLDKLLTSRTYGETINTWKSINLAPLPK